MFHNLWSEGPANHRPCGSQDDVSKSLKWSTPRWNVKCVANLRNSYSCVFVFRCLQTNGHVFDFLLLFSVSFLCPWRLKVSNCHKKKKKVLSRGTPLHRMGYRLGMLFAGRQSCWVRICWARRFPWYRNKISSRTSNQKPFVSVAFFGSLAKIHIIIEENVEYFLLIFFFFFLHTYGLKHVVSQDIICLVWHWLHNSARGVSHFSVNGPRVWSP